MEHRLREEVSERLKRFKKVEAILMVVFVVALLVGILLYANADRINFERMMREIERKALQEQSGTVIGAPEGIVPLLQDRVPGWEAAGIDGPHPAGAARRKGCKYFVTEREISPEELENAAYRATAKKGSYHLYESMLEPGEWKITQYGTVSGLQSMCYSLVSQEGAFILIDGGHDVDQESLRKLIGEFGDRVDLWICSHFHEDHIGAITAMLQAPGPVQIGEIWCPPMDIGTYKTFAKEWDNIDTCEKFLQEISGMENVVRIEIGETRDIAGLSFEILSSYRADAPWCQEGNNCGLFFKVKGKQETMLFCCDIGGSWISEALVSSYGDRLKADYVQMGHHGNGGLSEEAYRIVAPKAAFFDGPQWLFDDTEKYTAAANRQLMESLGCEIYLLDEAPNSVILK